MYTLQNKRVYAVFEKPLKIRILIEVMEWENNKQNGYFKTQQRFAWELNLKNISLTSIHIFPLQISLSRAFSKNSFSKYKTKYQKT